MMAMLHTFIGACLGTGLALLIKSFFSSGPTIIAPDVLRALAMNPMLREQLRGPQGWPGPTGPIGPAGPPGPPGLPDQGPIEWEDRLQNRLDDLANELAQEAVPREGVDPFRDEDARRNAPAPMDNGVAGNDVALGHGAQRVRFEDVVGPDQVVWRQAVQWHEALPDNNLYDFYTQALAGHRRLDLGQVIGRPEVEDEGEAHRYAHNVYAALREAGLTITPAEQTAIANALKPAVRRRAAR